jgi:aconitate hydratase
MGAELGASTSIFPSDEVTREFLKAQGREKDYVPLASDENAEYDEIINIDLSSLKPLVACPHSPDNVKTVDEVGNIAIDQVCIGSCTNSSYVDLMKVAYILKGKTVADNVSLAIAPGSKQVYNMLAANGALADIIAAGARVLECACGPASVWDSRRRARESACAPSTATSEEEAEPRTLAFTLSRRRLRHTPR